MHRALVVVVLVGCGGGIPSSDYLARLVDARCSYLTRCGLFPDTATCKTFLPQAADPSFQAAIDAGRSHYDADKAEQCVNQVANASCDLTSQEGRESPSVCQEVLTGTGTASDPCASNSECTSQVCNVPTCTMACCTGTCGPANPPAKLGEPCATRTCDRGLACDNTKTCVALFAAGSPCTSGAQCAYGLGCVGTPATCQALPPIGQACVAGSCADLGATCIAGTCKPVGLPGATCTRTLDCSPFDTCDTTGGQCTAFPTLGMACATRCSDGSYCNSATSTCEAPQASGAPCVYGDECASRFCDDSSGAGHCADPPVCI